MSNPFIGEIRPFAFNFYPGDGNWLPCNGQNLPISQYQPLYSLIGTTYGGDGHTYFNLPNLNGATGQVGLSLLGTGTAASGTTYTLGQKSGVNTVTLSTAQMPAHSHTITAINAVSTSTYGPPAGGTSHLSRYFQQGNGEYAYSDQPVSGTLAPTTLSPSGGGQAHDNMQPYLAFTFAIAVDGDYPPHP